MGDAIEGARHGVAFIGVAGGERRRRRGKDGSQGWHHGVMAMAERSRREIDCYEIFEDSVN